MKRNIPPDELPTLSNGNQLEYRFPFTVDVWMRPVIYMDDEMSEFHDSVLHAVTVQAITRLVQYRPKVLIMDYPHDYAEYFIDCDVDVWNPPHHRFNTQGVLENVIPHYDIIFHSNILTVDQLCLAHTHRTLIMSRMLVWNHRIWDARSMFSDRGRGALDRSRHSPTSVFIDMDSDSPYARAWVGGDVPRKLMQNRIIHDFDMWGD